MKNFYAVVGMRNASRSYFVRYQHQLHSLKAVVTFALKQELPQTTSRDFHAADAAQRLRQLGFDVVHNANEKDDVREREWLSRLSRRGQALFRSKLIDLYGRCPLTGCTTLAALEAAHVNPVASQGLDAVSNGILLRADLHKLFDANLIAIEPRSGRVFLSPECQGDYAHLAEVSLRPPSGGPILKAFEKRWESFIRADQTCPTPEH